MKTLVSAAVFAALTATAIAEPITIFISGNRSIEPGLDIPAGYRVITSEEISESGSNKLIDVLKKYAGLRISDGNGGGGTATIDMRGFGSNSNSNIAILINGRKINASTDASEIYLNTIALNNVERIEIIEGSAGTLYGNQAVGGLVNVITRKKTALKPQITSSIGSYNSKSIAFDAAGNLDAPFFLNISASSDQSDNYREHNRSDTKKLDIELTHLSDSLENTLSLSFLDDFLENPGALTAAEMAIDRRQVSSDFQNDYSDTSSSTFRLSTALLINSSWKVENDFSYRNDHRDFMGSYTGAPATTIDTQDRESFEISPRIIGHKDKHKFTLGFDALHTDYLLVTSYGPQGDKQKIHAIYGQLQTQVNSKTTLTGGIRYAEAEDNIHTSNVILNDDVTVGSIGVTHKPLENTRLYARADQNYRFAKVDEHTNTSVSVGLKTQTGTSWETGIEWTKNNDKHTARLYRLNLNNEIGHTANGWYNMNLESTRRIGMSLSSQKQINENLLIGAGYDYIDSELTEGTNAGAKVPLVAEHHFTAFTEYQFSKKHKLTSEIEYTGERYLSSDYQNVVAPLEASTVFNLIGSHTVDDWTLNFRVNNVLNEKYNASGAKGSSNPGYNPAPERNFLLTAKYTFE